MFIYRISEFSDLFIFCFKMRFQNKKQNNIFMNFKIIFNLYFEKKKATQFLM